MAWQTPKVDWSREDGVRDSDLNRIEGNILELYNASSVRADRVVYVDASAGNDTIGNGSVSSPYATITKALDSIPRNINDKNVIVSIAGGTYQESVTIKGFSAPITLMAGRSGETVEVSSFRVDGCHCSFSGNIEIKSTSTIYVTNCGTLTGAGRLAVDGAYISVNYGSVLSLDVLTCDNSDSFAIVVDRSSKLFASMIQGEGNSYGISCQAGSFVSFGDNYLDSGSPEYFTAMGGRIYAGAQDSVPTY